MKDNDNNASTHHELLPGLVDAFKNRCDLPLIVLMSCNLYADCLRLELCKILRFFLYGSKQLLTCQFMPKRGTGKITLCRIPAPAFPPRYLAPSQSVLSPPLQALPQSRLCVGLPHPCCLLPPRRNNESISLDGRTATHVFYLEGNLDDAGNNLGWIRVYGIWQPLEERFRER